VDRYKMNLLMRVGLATFLVGCGLRLWTTHGGHAEFAAGFFLGLSIVLMLAGLVTRSRGIPK